MLGVAKEVDELHLDVEHQEEEEEDPMALGVRFAIETTIQQRIVSIGKTSSIIFLPQPTWPPAMNQHILSMMEVLGSQIQEPIAMSSMI